MKRNEYVFTAVLVLSSAMIVYGAAQVFAPVAWVTGGVLTAALGWLTLSETK